LRKLSNRLLPGRCFVALLVFFLFASCDRFEYRYVFIWDDTFGKGSALDVDFAPDSTIVACGHNGENPYLLKLTGNRTKEMDFISEMEGAYTSLWSDTSGYIVAGTSGGSMLLSKIDKLGALVWDTTLTAGFGVDVTNIYRVTDKAFLAVGSARADTLRDGVTGLFFVYFDVNGLIASKREVLASYSVYAENGAMDNSRNLYLSITRKVGTGKPIAGVAKYNDDLYKLWETDLYNNQNYGAESLGLHYSGGVVYLTGMTMTTSGESAVNNSFIAAINASNGDEIWKKYRENSNSGVDILQNGDATLMALNRNCFVVSLADPADGTDLGKIRMFDGCDSYSSTAFGTSCAMDYGGNLLLGGSKGGDFFVALKATDVIDEF